MQFQNKVLRIFERKGISEKWEGRICHCVETPELSEHCGDSQRRWRFSHWRRGK